MKQARVALARNADGGVVPFVIVDREAYRLDGVQVAWEGASAHDRVVTSVCLCMIVFGDDCMVAQRAIAEAPA